MLWNTSSVSTTEISFLFTRWTIFIELIRSIPTIIFAIAKQPFGNTTVICMPRASTPTWKQKKSWNYNMLNEFLSFSKISWNYRQLQWFITVFPSFIKQFKCKPVVQFLFLQMWAGSSLSSPQSLSKSHFHKTGIHLPLLQENSVSGSHARLSEMKMSNWLKILSLWKKHAFKNGSEWESK